MEETVEIIEERIEGRKEKYQRIREQQKKNNHFILLNIPAIWHNICQFADHIKMAIVNHKRLASFSGIALLVLALMVISILNYQKYFAQTADAPATTTETTKETHKHVTATTKPLTPVKVVDPETQNKVVPATPVDKETYTVQEGDTLWDIAQAVYGNGNDWVRLYNDNKDILMGQDRRNALQSGHWIHAGEVLIIHTE